MTYVDFSDEPPADVQAPSVLGALLRAGRWADAAAYAEMVDDLGLVPRAGLLLAAGRAGEAHVLLASHAMEAVETTPWARFLGKVDRLVQGDVQLLPDLVSESDRLPHSVLVPLLMLRAADRAGRTEIAAHFARQVLQLNPGDVDAARTVAIELVNRGEYVEAVNLLDRAEAARCGDEASALDEVLQRLRPHQARAGALVNIGRHMHRERDPARPVSEAARAARQRWRSAYRTFGTRYWGRRLAWLASVAVMVSCYLVLGNVLPGCAVAVAMGAWLRSRPLPGLDLRTSRLVRAVSDPRTILLARRYSAFDVFTFVFSAVVLGGLATQLPAGPAWLGGVEAGAVVLIAAVATRGRRRWIRHQREKVIRPPYDPAVCSCLDVASLQGPQSRDYVNQHLFHAGTVRGRPNWRVLQCLGTHIQFLDLLDPQLTIRLAQSESAEPRWHAHI